MFGVNLLSSPKGVTCLGYDRKSKFKKPGKIFLNISAKYRVYYMQIARLFQQCTNWFEKESSVTNVAGLPVVNSYGT
jgi:hypothetical protein